jgi:hypothetical protein
MITISHFSLVTLILAVFTLGIFVAIYIQSQIK